MPPLEATFADLARGFGFQFVGGSRTWFKINDSVAITYEGDGCIIEGLAPGTAILAHLLRGTYETELQAVA